MLNFRWILCLFQGHKWEVHDVVCGVEYKHCKNCSEDNHRDH